MTKQAKTLALATIWGLMTLPMMAQNPPTAPPAAATPNVLFPTRMAQGGNGPIRVLFVSKGHDFDRDGLMTALDQLGRDITWTHVEHPAAEVFYDPTNAKDYDAFVFYDAPSRGAPTPQPPNGTPGYRDPGPKAKKDFARLVESGKGLVFLHHATAGWNHTWPEYSEMIGAACDWGAPVTFEGKTYPNSGARGRTPQHITVLDKNHPVTAGLGDGFDIVDETYLCETDEKLVHPLLKTDFVAIDKNFEARYAAGWRHPGQGTSLVGWYRAVGKSPLVYLQNGHDAVAWANPASQKLLTNAIKWVVSPEGKAFAAKEGKPMKIAKEVKNAKESN
jgi:type 1 glutamine amidotransferase